MKIDTIFGMEIIKLHKKVHTTVNWLVRDFICKTY